jgi:inner membrane protein
MPTEFTHIFVSGVFGKVYAPGKMPARFWALIALCSVVPDIDIVGYYFGIKYGDVWGHRGFTHSLTFAFLVSALVVVLAFPTITRFTKKWWGMLAFFFVVTASHGVLDAMTDKGMGVGFFIPFDNTRSFLPWRPVFASPMRISRFFSRTGLGVLTAEVVWIWIPLLLVYGAVSVYRKRKVGPPTT